MNSSHTLNKIVQVLADLANLIRIDHLWLDFTLLTEVELSMIFCEAASRIKPQRCPNKSVIGKPKLRTIVDDRDGWAALEEPCIFTACKEDSRPISSRPSCCRSTSYSWGWISAEYADLVVSIIAVWYLSNYNCLKCPHSSEKTVLLTIQTLWGCSPPTIMFRGGPAALGLAVRGMRGGYGGRRGDKNTFIVQFSIFNFVGKH